jgi:formylglycine-generating enzyme required for sulfatase activity
VTWTATPGTQEHVPINCVNWAEAYAFCIWDGAFLPSEAEWEYAAAGGSEQREYPWGSTDPGTADQFAIYGGYYAPGCTGASCFAPVGSTPSGAGRYGQLDLEGNAWTWTLDWYAPYAPCSNCAEVTQTEGVRVTRGCAFDSTAAYLLPTLRNSEDRYFDGIRCAREPAPE